MEFYAERKGTLQRADCTFQFPTGWNSTERKRIQIERVREVSIPNGMEFYVLILVILLSKMDVSIPNGMEFYASFVRANPLKAAFQFPTGWNSTEAKRHRNLLPRVSIPNGMEFYLFLAKFEIQIGGFNSQRDGILLELAKLLGHSTPFQFPTGWNSTFGKSFLILNMERFNSQRDGILHDINEVQAWFISKFQFPTGWNSTLNLLLFVPGSLFQFPTGWNSTQGYLYDPRRVRRFQFPTGWNST